ncbi:MAG TPA: peptidoglycan binding domain-containing protein, partial [Solirubrobacteraceae bacterium]
MALIRLYALLCALPILIANTGFAFTALAFADRVYPNVAVGGVLVGGLTSAEATARLRDHAARALTRPIVLQVEQDTIATSLAELGISLSTEDMRRSVAAALRVGKPPAGTTPLAFGPQTIRRLVDLTRDGEHLPLALSLDLHAARVVIGRAAQLLDQPAADAYMEIIPTEAGYELHTLPALTGRRVDVDAALAQLAALAAGGVLDDSPAPAVFSLPAALIPPAVTDDDLARLRARIDAVAGTPLTFDTGRPTTLRLEPAALVTALTLTGLTPGAYFDAATVATASAHRADLEIDAAVIAQLVADLAARADEPAQEPRLELQAGRIGIRPGQPGRVVDRDAALRDTLDRLGRAAAPTAPGDGATSRTIPLRYQAQKPALDPAALAPAAEIANARLALPLTFVYEDSP